MSTICIPIPDLHKHATVGIEVTIGGERRAMNYRVESFRWQEHAGPTERIDDLRNYLAEYDSTWELVQIGPPDGGLISVTFRQHVASAV
jgi:hypothetical protein